MFWHILLCSVLICYDKFCSVNKFSSVDKFCSDKSVMLCSVMFCLVMLSSDKRSRLCSVKIRNGYDMMDSAKRKIIFCSILISMCNMTACLVNSVISMIKHDICLSIS